MYGRVVGFGVVIGLSCVVACGGDGVDEGDEPGAGTLLRIEMDEGCDGTRDWCRSHSTTANGRQRTQGRDEDCDGEPESECATITLDAYGHAIGAVAQDNCDGVTRGTGCWQGTNDEHGNQLTFANDTQCNGELRNCSTNTFDADSNCTSIVLDSDCDGTPNYCAMMSYAVVGTIRQEIDHDCDGEVDYVECVVQVRDADDRVTSSHTDLGCTGQPTSACITNTYDTYGVTTFATGDQDCDGEPETCTVGSSSSDGLTRRTGTDTDCDGIADVHCTITTWTDAGLPLTVLRDGNCDGEPDGRFCHEYLYDDAGNAIGHRWDINCDDTDLICETAIHR